LSVVGEIWWQHSVRAPAHTVVLGVAAALCAALTGRSARRTRTGWLLAPVAVASTVIAVMAWRAEVMVVVGTDGVEVRGLYDRRAGWGEFEAFELTPASLPLAPTLTAVLRDGTSRRLGHVPTSRDGQKAVRNLRRALTHATSL
jgi:hypothetical protein